jgi:hypothetical protein
LNHTPIYFNPTRSSGIAKLIFNPIFLDLRLQNFDLDE